MEMVDKGNAEVIADKEIENTKVSDSETKNQNKKIWYLPHRSVVNPKKPGKIRPVHDCAAMFQGQSLNSQIHRGPDVVNKLLPVLLRFIFLISLIFFHYKGHLFGAVWCSNAATYALKRSCVDNDVNDDIKDNIYRPFYVDNCTKSHESVKDVLPAILTGDIESNGLKWDGKNEIDIPEHELTKRGMLSLLPKLYDPLGLIYCMLITGKLL